MKFIVILTIIIIGESAETHHIEYRSEKACLEAKELLDDKFKAKLRNTVTITTCSYRQ